VNWLTVDAAAIRMGLCRRTVYSLIRSGELKAIQVGRVLRVEPQAIDAFKRAHEKKSRFAPPRSQPTRPVLVSGSQALGGDRFR
jgi:excisionase family DNA binding protein